MHSRKVQVTIFLIIALSNSLLASGKDEQEDEENGKLWRLKLTTESQAQALRALAKKDHLDAWSHINIHSTTDIYIPNEHKDEFAQYLSEHGLSGSNAVEMVNSEGLKPENEQTRSGGSKKVFGTLTWDEYYNYTEIAYWLDELPKKYPNLAKLESIGTTLEERPIKLVTITSGEGKKPGVLINSIFHAREWITSAVVTYFINQLTEHADEYKELLEKYRFYFIPMVNPDGYEYSWTTNRLWRKNRNPNGGGENCSGVDLERNFDVDFGGVGSSDDLCDQTYRGPHAFSEKESQALRDFILAHPDITDYYSFHCYMQLWMTPWSYKVEHAHNYEETMAILGAAMQAQEAVHGTKYRYGASGDVYDTIGGTVEDWAMVTAKINYSYCIELRDMGEFAFKLPKEQILPSAEETWEALQYVVQKLTVYRPKSKTAGISDSGGGGMGGGVANATGTPLDNAGIHHKSEIMMLPPLLLMIALIGNNLLQSQM